MGSHDLSNAHASGIECLLKRCSRVRILEGGTADRWVNEGHDPSKDCGCGQGRVTADRGDVDEEGVEVLLSGN
jgi:hypothetical protein